MPKHPVKLTRGEIVLPPRVAQQYRQKLEAMNRMGLQARNMGGVIQYRQAGGGIFGNLSSQDRIALGNSLAHLATGDIAGASDVLAKDRAARSAAKGDLTGKMLEALRKANPHLT